MPDRPRMTIATQLVLRAMLEYPTREMYGLELCAAAGLASGTIHPILARLEKLGWVESKWEEVDPREASRPRRRYYRLSTEGAEQARHALAQTRNTAAMFRPSPGNPAYGIGSS